MKNFTICNFKLLILKDALKNESEKPIQIIKSDNNNLFVNQAALNRIRV